MKIKKSILRRILKGIRRGISKFKNNLSKFKNLLFQDESKAIKHGKNAIKSKPKNSFLTVGILEDKSNLFYSVYDENEPGNCRLISYEARMLQYELEKRKEIAKLENKAIPKSVDDIEIDICDGSKYIVRKTIKSIYLKAKNLYVNINGYVLKTNKLYRECIEAYTTVRKEFSDNYNEEILNNEVLYSFVKDNNINLNNIKDNFEILLKLFIADVYTNLYISLVKFSEMFDQDIYACN